MQPRHTPSPLPPHRAYSLLAPHYDRLFGSYARHTRPWLGRFIRGLRPRPRSILDLACGSGRSAVAFARLGARVQAIDLNPGFVRQTRLRARNAGLKVEAYAADMRRFKARRPVDLVTCLFDSINHLPRRSDLASMLDSVHRALEPGGLFLFDVITPHGLRRVWPTMRAIWRGRGWFAAARGRFDPARSRAGRPAPVSLGRAFFEIHWFNRRPDGTYRPSLEVFEEVSWTDAEIKRALAAAGFVSVRKIQDPALATVTGPDGRVRSFYLARRAD